MNRLHGTVIGYIKLSLSYTHICFVKLLSEIADLIVKIKNFDNVALYFRKFETLFGGSLEFLISKLMLFLTKRGTTQICKYFFTYVVAYKYSFCSATGKDIRINECILRSMLFYIDDRLLFNKTNILKLCS